MENINLILTNHVKLVSANSDKFIIPKNIINSQHKKFTPEFLEIHSAVLNNNNNTHIDISNSGICTMPINKQFLNKGTLKLSAKIKWHVPQYGYKNVLYEKVLGYHTSLLPFGEISRTRTTSYKMVKIIPDDEITNYNNNNDYKIKYENTIIGHKLLYPEEINIIIPYTLNHIVFDYFSHCGKIIKDILIKTNEPNAHVCLILNNMEFIIPYVLSKKGHYVDFSGNMDGQSQLLPNYIKMCSNKYVPYGVLSCGRFQQIYIDIRGKMNCYEVEFTQVTPVYGHDNKPIYTS